MNKNGGIAGNKDAKEANQLHAVYQRGRSLKEEKVPDIWRSHIGLARDMKHLEPGISGARWYHDENEESD